MTTPFRDEISKYFQSILTNISRIRQRITVRPKFQLNQKQFLVRRYKDKKHLRQILLRGIGMFVEQEQLNAESIAKYLQNKENAENRQHICNTREITNRKQVSTPTPASLLSSSLTIHGKTFKRNVILKKMGADWWKPRKNRVCMA